MAQTGDQTADRDIFNIAKGDVNVHNYAPLTAVDVTLDEALPPYYHWQPRREEQQILADLPTEVQLIQIIGVGGYGKSALATRVFEQAEGFQQKIWVSFRPIFSEQEFPPFQAFGRWIGRKLGYQPNPDWTDVELATEALNRLAQQRCLLVLDNLETLLEPTGQWRDLGYRNFFLRWFETGGRGVLLVTSRERPDLPANKLSYTRSYPIGGLPVEQAVALLTAQQVQGSKAELQEYVVVADGHPLLLNLTVGFLKDAAGDCPPISVLKRPEFNLFEVVGQHRGDPQTSIELVLNESIRRLDGELLAVLFEVWAFPMPFTQTLLKIARNSAATEAQLRQLAKRSLLQENPRPEGWTFQFQPLIRAYLQQQRLNFYRTTNDRLGEANTLQAIGEVLQFLARRTEALEHYEQAIGIYRAVGDRLGEANTLQAIGDVLQFLDRRTEAMEHYEQAIGICRAVGARLGEANTLRAIGDVLQFLKRSTEAMEHYEQAIGIYRAVGDRLGEANTLQAIGTLQEDPQVGLEHLKRAQKIYEQIGNKYSQSRNLLFVADCYIQLQQIDTAIETLQRSAAIASEISYEHFQQYASNKIAELQQPVSTSRLPLLALFSSLRRGHYALLGVSAFILVLVIRWLTHK